MVQIKIFKGVNVDERYINRWLEQATETIEIIDIKVTSVTEKKNGQLFQYIQYTVIYKKTEV